MSDCCINIRVIFWHIQYTTYGRWRFSFNRWLWQWRKLEVAMKPIWIHEFDLSRRNTEQLAPLNKRTKP